MKRMDDRGRRGKRSRATIGVALALAVVLVALASGAWAVSGKSKPKPVDLAATLTLSPDATETPHELFTVGGVTFDGVCYLEGGGTTVKVRVTVSPAGAVLAGLGSYEVLGPNETEALTAHGEGAVVSGEYAIFDKGGTTGTGIAASWVDPDTGRCVVSAQFAG
jgi:hypothetical protein